MTTQLTWDQYDTSSTNQVVPNNQPATPKTSVTSPKSREQLHKEFIKIFDGLCHAHHRWEVWQDWTEAAAISIQKSLIGCPAQLVHGNTLKLENKQTWYTPMWYLRGFN